MPEAVEVEPYVWTVPSLSEGGVRIVRGSLINDVIFLECDCQAGYYARRRVICRHVKIVTAHIKLRIDQGLHPSCHQFPLPPAAE